MSKIYQTRRAKPSRMAADKRMVAGEGILAPYTLKETIKADDKCFDLEQMVPQNVHLVLFSFLGTHTDERLQVICGTGGNSLAVACCTCEEHNVLPPKGTSSAI
jgi:hypothetical protein